MWGCHSLRGDGDPWGASQGQHGGAGPFPANPPAFSADLSFPVDPPHSLQTSPILIIPHSTLFSCTPCPDTPQPGWGPPNSLLGRTGAGERGPGGGYGRGHPGSRLAAWCPLPKWRAPGPPWGAQGEGARGRAPQQAGRRWWQWELTPRPPCRAPGPPCPAPRPVSASPRTCYLVTRL